jgi:hypothetical protein
MLSHRWQAEAGPDEKKVAAQHVWPAPVAEVFAPGEDGAEPASRKLLSLAEAQPSGEELRRSMAAGSAN